MESDKCIPKTKFDTAAIMRAQSVGFPALNPVIPNLLEWLQDANWPIAASTAELLTHAGTEIIAPIQSIFHASDAIWKYWVIELLVACLDASLKEALRGDLEGLANTPNERDRAEEVHFAARNVLQEMK